MVLPRNNARKPSGAEFLRRRKARDLEKKKMAGQLRRYFRPRGIPTNPCNGATADVIITPASSAGPNGPPEDSVGSQPAGSATVASGTEQSEAMEMKCSEDANSRPADDTSAKEQPESKDVDESDVAQGNEELEGRSSPSAQEVDPAGCSQHESQEAGDQNPGLVQSSVSAGSLKEMAEKLDDVGQWPYPVPKNLIPLLATKPLAKIQNCRGPFRSRLRPAGPATKAERRALNKSWFYKQIANGQKIPRTWLAYSPTTGKVYCICCRLFQVVGPLPKLATMGYNIWWKLSSTIPHHEETKQHKDCERSWKSLCISLGRNNKIEAVQQRQLLDRSRMPKEVLTRILRCIMYLAGQNIDLHGHHEGLQNEEISHGNLLELMELLAKFDPVLGAFMARAKVNPSSPHYLSPQIVNELIEMASCQMRKKIFDEVKEAKYYALILDSTPDASGQEQMSQVLRYVAFEEDKVVVKEAFVDLMNLEGHASVPALAQYILEKLEEDGLEIADCRAQGYNNASTMAGFHESVQLKIHQVNDKAIFLSCSNHTLNLAGAHASTINSTNGHFFAQLKSLFAFFHASPHRWAILRQKTCSTLKPPSSTEWSFQKEAVEVCATKFDGIIEALTMLEDPKTELPATRKEVQLIKERLVTFKFLAALEFWDKVLAEVNKVHGYLQKCGLDLEQHQMRMSELVNFLKREKGPLVLNAVTAAKKKCEELEIAMEVRPKKMRLDGEEHEDCSLETKAVIGELHEAIDFLYADTERRFEQLSTLAIKFACLHPKKLLNSVEDEKLRKDLHNLAQFYRGDVEQGAAIMEEVKVLRVYETRGNLKDESYSGLLEWILQRKMEEVFPNLMTLLKICLTVCISAATCERNFPKMERIRSHVHSTVGPKRSSALAMLSIEKDAVKKLNFDECLKNFAALTARKIIP